MTPTLDPRLAPLRTEAGSFSMLAIDQRESLRGMMPRTPEGGWAPDDRLAEFKAAAVRILSEHASGLLIDRPLGLRAGRPAGLAEGCGLIVAADVLHQRTGEPLAHSTIDPLVDARLLHEVEAVAVKFLILWKADEPASVRREVLEPFVGFTRETGLLSLIECIVRPPADRDWTDIGERHDAILEAAAELAVYDPDIYKAEVPGYVSGDVSGVAEHARLLSGIVPGPWVVLSNGVEPAIFPEALAETMRGGASGFLAGRAIWQDIAGRPDFERGLAEHGPARLDRLRAIADAAFTARTVGEGTA